MVHWQKGKELKNGKFVIEEILGSGGFGITYKIVNPRTQEQFVIKTLNAIARSKKNFPELQDDFFNEAIKLAAFNHPNVVKVYPRGFSEDGLWCMLMEYIQGQNLEEYLQKNKQISESAAIALITKVGEALTYIHQRNYIHRDIKPSNIMLCNSNLSSPVLIDFGLAREFDPKKSMSMDNRLTEHFAPLEQYNLESYAKYINLERNQYRVGTWTDVYALAATLYVLLTRDIPMSAPMRKLSPKDFKPPKQLNPQISESVNGAILKGMAIEPQNRSQTVQQWLNLLKKVSFKDRDRVKSSTKSQSSYKAKSNFQSSQKNSQAEAAAKTRQASKKKQSSSPVNSSKKSFKPKRKIKLNGKTIGILVGSYFTFSVIYQNWNTMVAPVILGINLEQALDSNIENFARLELSPNGKTLSNIGYENIELWNMETEERIATLKNRSHIDESVSFSPDGNILASAGWDSINLWEAATGKEITSFKYKDVNNSVSQSIQFVAFSPDGKILASNNGSSRTIELWDIETGQEISSLAGHSSPVNLVVFSPDGKTFASGSNFEDGIKLWDINTKEEITTLEDSSLIPSAFSLDGKVLASKIEDGIKLWDIVSKKEKLTITGYQASSAKFSPDSSVLAAIRNDNDYKTDTITLWDISTGKEKITLKGHPESIEISSLAFSSDGKTLVSGAWDNTIKLWDIETGKEIATLTTDSDEYQDRVVSVAFSPDEQTLVSVHESNSNVTINLWTIPSTSSK